MKIEDLISLLQKFKTIHPNHEIRVRARDEDGQFCPAETVALCYHTGDSGLELDVTIES